MFRVGQRVVCVDAKPVYRRGDIVRRLDGIVVAITKGLDGLAKGKIYTIRTIESCHYTGETAIHLEEIVRPLNDLGEEVPFLARRFRPVVERKTLNRDFRSNAEQGAEAAGDRRMTTRLGLAKLVADAPCTMAAGMLLEIFWDERGALYARPVNAPLPASQDAADQISVGPR